MKYLRDLQDRNEDRGGASHIEGVYNNCVAVTHWKPSALSTSPHTADLTGKEFQYKTFWQWSLTIQHDLDQ